MNDERAPDTEPDNGPPPETCRHGRPVIEHTDKLGRCECCGERGSVLGLCPGCFEPPAATLPDAGGELAI